MVMLSNSHDVLSAQKAPVRQVAIAFAANTTPPIAARTTTACSIQPDRIVFEIRSRTLRARRQVDPSALPSPPLEECQ